MSQIVQVELRTDTTHTMTWLDAALRPNPGMGLLCKGCPAPVGRCARRHQHHQGVCMDWKVRAF
jgi:hypothetical protein